MSSPEVGMTSWAAGSVKTKPTLRRISRPFSAVNAVDEDASGGGGDQAVEESGEGGLAGAVGSDQGDAPLP
jgi:hypothetical protein